MPPPPLGELGLEFGLFVFVLFVEPLAAAVLKPRTDLGVDCAVARNEQPQRFVPDQFIGPTQWLDLDQHIHVARRVRLDRAFDVRPFERELTPTC